MLDPRETFEKYERRSPQPTIERREYLACEYRREPVHQGQNRLACELRGQQNPSHQREHARIACEYRRDPRPEHGQLACELRARPTTTVTTYLPENNKRKLPIGLIVGIAICIPIFIVIILFAAVWLQEVGIL